MASSPECPLMVIWIPTAVMTSTEPLSLISTLPDADGPSTSSLVQKADAANKSTSDVVDPSYKTWFKEAVAKIKGQKQRPTLERIADVMKTWQTSKYPSITAVETKEQIDLAVRNGDLLQIYSNGQPSWMDRETLKTGRKFVINSDKDVHRAVARTLMDLGDPSNLTAEDILNFVTSTFTSKIPVDDLKAIVLRTCTSERWESMEKEKKKRKETRPRSVPVGRRNRKKTAKTLASATVDSEGTMALKSPDSSSVRSNRPKKKKQEPVLAQPDLEIAALSEPCISSTGSNRQKKKTQKKPVAEQHDLQMIAAESELSMSTGSDSELRMSSPEIMAPVQNRSDRSMSLNTTGHSAIVFGIDGTFRRAFELLTADDNNVLHKDVTPDGHVRTETDRAAAVSDVPDQECDLNLNVGSQAIANTVAAELVPVSSDQGIKETEAEPETTVITDDLQPKRIDVAPSFKEKSKTSRPRAMSSDKDDTPTSAATTTVEHSIPKKLRDGLSNYFTPSTKRKPRARTPVSSLHTASVPTPSRTRLPKFTDSGAGSQVESRLSVPAVSHLKTPSRDPVTTGTRAITSVKKRSSSSLPSRRSGARPKKRDKKLSGNTQLKGLTDALSRYFTASGIRTRRPPRVFTPAKSPRAYNGTMKQLCQELPEESPASSRRGDKANPSEESGDTDTRKGSKPVSFKIPETIPTEYEELFREARKNALGKIPTVAEDYDSPLPPKVQLGSYQIQAWYTSPFPEEYIRCLCLYMCEFCLQYMKTIQVLRCHCEKCPWHRPPGTEIYHDHVDTEVSQELIIYETDGNEWKEYCQNLCLLAKLFLDHKTLYYDVETFLFYVLCRRDKFGDHIIGYFSKEKNCPRRYNVSCIMVLPPYQGGGYGRYLIDFSYLLSRVERQYGTPEKPLSEMGQISYEAYWRSVVLDFFVDKQKKIATTTSIKAICDSTGMWPQDVADTLQQLDFIVKNEETQSWEFVVVPEVVDDYVAKKAAGRARLFARAEKLKWEPRREENAGIIVSDSKETETDNHPVETGDNRREENAGITVSDSREMETGPHPVETDTQCDHRREGNAGIGVSDGREMETGPVETDTQCDQPEGQHTEVMLETNVDQVAGSVTTSKKVLRKMRVSRPRRLRKLKIHGKKTVVAPNKIRLSSSPVAGGVPKPVKGKLESLLKNRERPTPGQDDTTEYHGSNASSFFNSPERPSSLASFSSADESLASLSNERRKHRAVRKRFRAISESGSSARQSPSPIAMSNAVHIPDAQNHTPPLDRLEEDHSNLPAVANRSKASDSGSGRKPDNSVRAAVRQTVETSGEQTISAVLSAILRGLPRQEPEAVPTDVQVPFHEPAQIQQPTQLMFLSLEQYVGQLGYAAANTMMPTISAVHPKSNNSREFRQTTMDHGATVPASYENLGNCDRQYSPISTVGGGLPSTSPNYQQQLSPQRPIAPLESETLDSAVNSPYPVATPEPIYMNRTPYPSLGPAEDYEATPAPTEQSGSVYPSNQGFPAIDSPAPQQAANWSHNVSEYAAYPGQPQMPQQPPTQPYGYPFVGYPPGQFLYSYPAPQGMMVPCMPGATVRTIPAPGMVYNHNPYVSTQLQMNQGTQQLAPQGIGLPMLVTPSMQAYMNQNQSMQRFPGQMPTMNAAFQQYIPFAPQPGQYSYQPVTTFQVQSMQPQYSGNPNPQQFP